MGRYSHTTSCLFGFFLPRSPWEVRRPVRNKSNPARYLRRDLATIRDPSICTWRCPRAAIGLAGKEFGSVSRGLSCVLFRPRIRWFRLFLLRFLRLAPASVARRLRRLRFYFFSFGFCVGSYFGCAPPAPAPFMFRVRCCVFYAAVSGTPYIDCHP